MAENDRFERQVGKRWKTACRLILGGGELTATADAIVKPIGELLRENDCSALPKIAEILATAARPAQSGQLEFFAPEENFRIERAWVALEELERDAEPEVSRIFVEEANRVLIQIRTAENVTADSIQERLAECIVWRLADQQLLSRVRDEVMKRQKRAPEEQERFEAQVRELVSGQAKKLLDPAFTTGEAPKRVPPRLTQKMDVTLDALRQPLPVIASRYD